MEALGYLIITSIIVGSFAFLYDKFRDSMVCDYNNINKYTLKQFLLDVTCFSRYLFYTVVLQLLTMQLLDEYTALSTLTIILIGILISAKAIYVLDYLSIKLRDTTEVIFKQIENRIKRFFQDT